MLTKTNQAKFAHGDRVRLTAEGRQSFPSFRGLVGTIVSKRHRGDTVIVQWDGRRSLTPLSRFWLALVQPAAPADTDLEAVEKMLARLGFSLPILPQRFAESPKGPP